MMLGGWDMNLTIYLILIVFPFTFWGLTAGVLSSGCHGGARLKELQAELVISNDVRFCKCRNFLQHIIWAPKQGNQLSQSNSLQHILPQIKREGERPPPSDVQPLTVSDPPTALGREVPFCKKITCDVPLRRSWVNCWSF